MIVHKNCDEEGEKKLKMDFIVFSMSAGRKANVNGVLMTKAMGGGGLLLGYQPG